MYACPDSAPRSPATRHRAEKRPTPRPEGGPFSTTTPLRPARSPVPGGSLATGTGGKPGPDQRSGRFPDRLVMGQQHPPRVEVGKTLEPGGVRRKRRRDAGVRCLAGQLRRTELGGEVDAPGRRGQQCRQVDVRPATGALSPCSRRRDETAPIHRTTPRPPRRTRDSPPPRILLTSSGTV